MVLNSWKQNKTKTKPFQLRPPPPPFPFALPCLKGPSLCFSGCFGWETCGLNGKCTPPHTHSHVYLKLGPWLEVPFGEVMELQGSGALLEELHHWGAGYSLIPLPSHCFLITLGMWWLSFQLLHITALLPCTTDSYPSGAKSQTKCFCSQAAFGRGALSQQQKTNWYMYWKHRLHLLLKSCLFITGSLWTPWGWVTCFTASRWQH